MERVVVFAAFDRQGIVSDYIVSYLRQLKTVASKIIFIADNTVDKSQKDKLSGLVDYAQFEPHGEYDFGSYKRGYAHAQAQGWLDTADELVLCNDSCFCVVALEPIFAQMSEHKCDFWGLMRRTYQREHLQGYFLVFRKPVIRSNALQTYLAAVRHQDNFADVVNQYELPLKEYLEQKGFVAGCFLSADNLQISATKNPTSYPSLLYQNGFPLVKKKVFLNAVDCMENPRKILKQVPSPTYQDIVQYNKRHFPPFPILMKWDLSRCRQQIKHFAVFVLHLFVQIKITKKNKLLIKIFKIPVVAKAISHKQKEQSQWTIS